jgi:2-iminobutanoate/2-iminopropanoate deaminase
MLYVDKSRVKMKQYSLFVENILHYFFAYLCCWFHFGFIIIFKFYQMQYSVSVILFICFALLLAGDCDTVQRIFPKGVPAAIGPYTPVTIIGTTVYISGQIAINPVTGNIEADDIVGQTHQTMKNLKAALDGAGITFSDVAKTTVYLSDMSYFSEFNNVYAQYFEKDKYPARVCIAVKSLPKPNALV